MTIGIIVGGRTELIRTRRLQDRLPDIIPIVHVGHSLNHERKQHIAEITISSPRPGSEPEPSAQHNLRQLLIRGRCSQPLDCHNILGVKHRVAGTESEPTLMAQKMIDSDIPHPRVAHRVGIDGVVKYAILAKHLTVKTQFPILT